MVVRYSDWTTLVAWRRASRTFFGVVSVNLRRRYESCVRPVVSDVEVFDNLLRAHGGVISGSTALHFVLPGEFRIPGGLDIYMPANSFKAFVRAVVDPLGLRWTHIRRRRKKSRSPSGTDPTAVPDSELDELLSDEQLLFAELSPPHQYGGLPPERLMAESARLAIESGDGDEFASDDDSGPDSNQEDRTDLYVDLEHYTPRRPSMVYGKGFRAIRKFRTPANRRVNVLCSHSNNPVSPLRYLWSSLLMNFITPDGFVCGFPSATLERRGALRLEPLTGREDAALERYRSRGFDFDAEGLRESLDMWDYIFFGERVLLSMDFRVEFGAVRRGLPLKATARGWLMDAGWKMRTTVALGS